MAIATVLTLLGMIAAPVLAQRTGAPESQPQRIVITPDRLTVEVWLDRGQPARYRTGESIQISFRTSKDAYVTIFDHTTDGDIVRLFPNAYDRNNLVRGGDVHAIPAEGYDLRISGPPGTEQVRVYATTDRRFAYSHDVSEPYVVVPEREHRSTVQRIEILPDAERAVAAVQFRVVSGRGGGGPYPHPGGDHWRPEPLIEQLYRGALGRSPSSSEKRQAVSELERRASEDVVLDVLASDEHFVRSVYRALLGREPDESGLRHYTSQLGGGRMDRRAVIAAVLESTEFRRR